LEAGADKVGVNSAAVKDPQLLARLAAKFGRQCIVIAIDAKRKQQGSGWEVVVKSGTEVVASSDAVEWAKQATQLGAGEVLLTSFDQDGTKEGYDLELVRAVAEAVTVPVIASGGASCAKHMYDAVVKGKADAVLAASIFHDGEITVGAIKQEIADIDLAAVGQGERAVVFREVTEPSAGGFTPSLDVEFDRCRQAVIPSIDILDGDVVQLVGGDPDAPGKIICGNPLEVIEKMGLLGEVAVIDLNAALRRPMPEGRGTSEPYNRTVIKEIAKRGWRIRVGGGVRDYDTAKELLDAGIAKIIVGTMAKKEFLEQLPRERLIVALDNKKGEIVTDGWRTTSAPGGAPGGCAVSAKIKELGAYCIGFLITFVESEGRMTGMDGERILKLKQAAMTLPSPPTLTIAGGIATQQDLQLIDRLGCEAQIGMALYTGKVTLSQCLTSVIKTDRPDGLYPTIVVEDSTSGKSHTCLGLCYSSKESIDAALESKTGVYWSRSRNTLWKKGATSGCVQVLKGIETDCDRDALVFRVKQEGNFCHRHGSEFKSCFGMEAQGLPKLCSTISTRMEELEEAAKNGGQMPPHIQKSYVHRLLKDPEMLNAKIREEAAELCAATTVEENVAECADVIFFSLVKLMKAGGTLEQVEKVLDMRSMKVSRRTGDAKAEFVAAEKAAATSAPAPTPTAPAMNGAGKTEFPAPGASMRRVKADELPSLNRNAVDPKALEVAKSIHADVKQNGAAALVKYAQKFGELKSASPAGSEAFAKELVAGKAEMEKAYQALGEEERTTLERTAERIRNFALGQRNCITNQFKAGCGAGGHGVAAVDVAGCYAPCGSYPLPSSVLMTAVTARAAGVKKVILATPCGSNSLPASDEKSAKTRVLMLAAAYIAKVDHVLLIGGAHAIAALAAGVPGSVPPCNVIVGPGNKYVTAAKSLVAGNVGIDFLAGPSEVAIIADANADADVIAKDLLAQAEHDMDSAPILISTCESKIKEVEAKLSESLVSLKNSPGFEDNARIAERALNDNGFAVFCPNGLDQAAEVANELAPEHLEVMVGPGGRGALAQQTAAKCTNYGAIFVGAKAAEVFGDYGAGPNHCLPTGSTAKSFGGLSVFTFLRVRTWLNCDTTDSGWYNVVVADAVKLARMEGLECHARAAEKRLSGHPTALASPSLVPKANKPQLEFTDMPPTLEEEALLMGIHTPGEADKVEIKWGIPKGRMYEKLVALLKDSNIDISVSERGLRPTVKGHPNWNFKLLKPRSLASMLNHGTRDIAFLGIDLIEEEGYNTKDIVPVFDTGLDIVRIVVAAPQSLIDEARKEREEAASSGVPLTNPIMSSLYPDKWLDLPTKRPLVVATEYPTLATRWLEKVGWADRVEVINSSGATEVFPPEDADFIIDNSATGTTLKANGLTIIDSIYESSTYLVASKFALQNEVKARTVQNLKLLLESALSARKSAWIEFNLLTDPGSADDMTAATSSTGGAGYPPSPSTFRPLTAAQKLTRLSTWLPAIQAPTVSNLFGKEGYAVKSIVPRDELSTLLPKIKLGGGRDIIVSNVNQVLL